MRPLTKRAIKRPEADTKKVAAPPRQSKGSASVTAREVGPLIERVVAILEEARSQVVRTVNSVMVLAYWHVGREIVQFVQGGAKRAEYGERMLEALSARLQERVGRGYSVRNLRYFRSFYQAYADREPLIRGAPVEFGTGLVPNLRDPGTLVAPSPTPQAPTEGNRILHEARAESDTLLTGFSAKLSWTHYRTLLTVEDRPARAFYEIEAEREIWSVPYLERQIHTQLFMRLLKSRNKAGVMDLAKRGQTVERPIDLMKSPVVLDFLDLPDSEMLRETDLESAILSKLSHFLLELGKGFAFVARQKRLTFEDEEFYVDLVFYNILLKCYLLIDLKLGKLAHQDVGQMDSYVRMFDAQGRTDGDGPTIGLILCAEKNESIARYSVLHEHKQLFAAKYVTHLPTVEELERELERDRRLAEALAPAPRPVKTRKGQRPPRSKARK
jgi:predicted nuclease of restriction endonuclease-like (RecB) superfamily